MQLGGQEFIGPPPFGPPPFGNSLGSGVVLVVVVMPPIPIPTAGEGEGGSAVEGSGVVYGSGVDVVVVLDDVKGGGVEELDDVIRGSEDVVGCGDVVVPNTLQTKVNAHIFREIYPGI